MKYIFWVLLTFGLILSAGLFARNHVVVYATHSEPQCVSTGPQCGTDNGTYSTYTCPQGYSEHNGSCKKFVCDYSYHGYCYYGHYDYKNKVETQHECNTGIVQYDSCAPEGQCPTVCGLNASEVSDGKGGTIQCGATPSCALCTDPSALNNGDVQVCRYASAAPPPQLASCEAPKYAPTVIYLGHKVVNGDNIFSYSWTTVKDELHTYLVESGETHDNLDTSVIQNGETIDINMYGKTSNWMRVAGDDTSCIGPFSEIVN